MDTITITAQQAAERLLTMKLGFAFLVIVVICATAWFIRIALMQTKCDVARSKRPPSVLLTGTSRNA